MTKSARSASATRFSARLRSRACRANDDGNRAPREHWRRVAIPRSFRRKRESKDRCKKARSPPARGRAEDRWTLYQIRNASTHQCAAVDADGLSGDEVALVGAKIDQRRD